MQFAAQYAQHAGEVTKIISAPIEMSADHFEMIGQLKAGNYAEIVTRKLGDGDCVCSNEKTFYPPLCKLRTASPAFTVQGEFAGPGLGTHWSNPHTRSAFLGTFSY